MIAEVPTYQPTPPAQYFLAEIQNTQGKNLMYNSASWGNNYPDDNVFIIRQANETIRKNIRLEKNITEISYRLFSEQFYENIKQEIFNFLNKHSFTKIVVEPTMDDSLLIKGFQGNIQFFLEIFPEQSNNWGYEAFINIVENGEIVLHQSGRIRQLSEYLNVK